MVTDKELLKLIKYKLGIFDLNTPISEEDIRRVEEITVNEKSFSGQDKGVDLTQISQLTGLKKLDLANFSIYKNQADAISRLQKLEELTISKSTVSASINTRQLESLTITDTEINDLSLLPLSESIDLYGFNAVNLDELEKQKRVLKDIGIYGGNVKRARKLADFEKLQTATLVGVRLDDKSIIDDLSDKGIEVEYEPEQRNIDAFFKQ